MTSEEIIVQASSDLTDVMSSLVSLIRQSWDLSTSQLILAVPLGFWVVRRVYKIFRSFF